MSRHPPEYRRSLVESALIAIAVVVLSILVIGLLHENAEVHARAAWEHGLKKEWAAAAAEYRRAVRDFPFKAEYHAGLARALEAQGFAEEAARARRRARLLGAE